jgi:peroxiredoxin
MSNDSRRPQLRAPLVLAAGLFLLAGCEPPALEGRRVGNKCPEIYGDDPDGKPVRLSEHRGKVVLVSFWGTWCAPCRMILPHEREMVEVKYKGRPFVLLGVAQDSADDLKAFQKTNPLPWPNIVDGSKIIAREWKIEGVPSAILVDHEGVIRKLWLDGINPTEVWNEVDKAVRAAEAP